MNAFDIRSLWSFVHTTTPTAVGDDDGGPLTKVAVAAIVANPFAGRGYVDDLSEVYEASAEVGHLLGTRALELLGAPAESYGKGGLAGLAGEQEHINACVTSSFGNALRDSIGGGDAWITSVTKVGGPNTTLDIPLAYRNEIWVRSHYDAITLTIPDGPRPDELAIVAAVADRGRLNARVGGKTRQEAEAACRHQAD